MHSFIHACLPACLPVVFLFINYLATISAVHRIASRRIASHAKAPESFGDLPYVSTAAALASNTVTLLQYEQCPEIYSAANYYISRCLLVLVLVLYSIAQHSTALYITLAVEGGAGGCRIYSSTVITRCGHASSISSFLTAPRSEVLGVGATALASSHHITSSHYY